eukprot:1305642-Alexandrium_andersonii.AAC.1
MHGEGAWPRAATTADEAPPRARPIPPEAARSARLRIPRASPRTKAKTGPRVRSGPTAEVHRPSKAARLTPADGAWSDEAEEEPPSEAPEPAVDEEEADQW